MNSANLYQFSSKMQHEQVGIYYYGFRWYAPFLQRWLNRDPIGGLGGLNLYQFVYNAPPNYIDPDGQFAFLLPIIIAIGEGLGISTGTAVAVGGAAIAAGAGYGVGTILTSDGSFSGGGLGTGVYYGGASVNAAPITIVFTTGPGRGNPGERRIQREKPNPDKTGDRDPQTGKPPKPEKEKPKPEKPTEKEWWEKWNQSDTPPKDLCPPRPN